MVGKILIGIVQRLDGWKSIVGYLVQLVSKALLSQFPEMPLGEVVIVLQWIGEMLLAIGLSHKGVKEIKALKK